MQLACDLLVRIPLGNQAKDLALELIEGRATRARRHEIWWRRGADRHRREAAHGLKELNALFVPLHEGAAVKVESAHHSSSSLERYADNRLESFACQSGRARDAVHSGRQAAIEVPSCGVVLGWRPLRGNT